MKGKANTQKVKAFFKKNIYYIVMVVCILAIAAMITVAVVLGGKESVEAPAPDGLPVIQISGYVGDTYCTMDALLHNTTLGGNYYVSPGPLLDALGATWTVTDGILTITTK